MNTIVVLDREDIRNPLHPALWESICDDLGLGPKCNCKDASYPDRIVLAVSKAEIDE